jgi:carboxypeptidase Q
VRKSLAGRGISWIVLLTPLVLDAQESIDLSILQRIKIEATERSQVMDHLSWLTDVHGPRLTNSPGFTVAAQWAVDRLRSMGIPGARLEPWGKFGRGWSFSRLSIQMLEPVAAPLIGAPLAWCGGTRGPVTGEVVLAPFDEYDRELDIQRMEEELGAWIAGYRGQLRGKVVLIRKARDLALPTKPAATRLEEGELASTVLAPDPSPGVAVPLPILKMPEDAREREKIYRNAPFSDIIDFWQNLRRTRSKLFALLAEEGALAALTTDDRGDGGIVFAEAAGRWEEGSPLVCPAIALMPEHYNRLARLAEKKMKVRVEIDLAVESHEQSLDGVNIIAEIPGGKKRSEIVMMGAHFDSWHTATGATDNAVGCAVALEAARIIQALDLKPDRTIRLALWSAEEQGILGSRSYVKNHFGDPATREWTPEHGRISAYFNLDNGPGKIRGIYLQGNDMARPIFTTWFAPFRDMGADTVSIRSTGGTDHLSFDAVGIPAFQFIQDPLDYGSRSHHSNMDHYDRAPPADLIEASIILATFVVETARREEILPRKTLPGAVPAKANDR